MDCRDCVWLERNYGKQTVSCAKGIFNEVPLANFKPVRRGCRWFETFHSAVQRIMTEQERRRKAA